VAFELYQLGAPDRGRTLSEVPLLVHALEAYLGPLGSDEYSCLKSLVEPQGGEYDPQGVLTDVLAARYALSRVVRPYCTWDPEWSPWAHFGGIRYFPRMIRPGGQIVQEWHAFRRIDVGLEHLAGERGVLLAGAEMLHLVFATASTLTATDDWQALQRISGRVLDWEDGLRADGVQVDAPRPFRRRLANARLARFSQVHVAQAWTSEFDALEQLARESIASTTRLVVPAF
jgi:hypothetical protein